MSDSSCGGFDSVVVFEAVSFSGESGELLCEDLVCGDCWVDYESVLVHYGFECVDDSKFFLAGGVFSDDCAGPSVGVLSVFGVGLDGMLGDDGFHESTESVLSEVCFYCQFGAMVVSEGLYDFGEVFVGCSALNGSDCLEEDISV